MGHGFSCFNMSEEDPCGSTCQHGIAFEANMGISEEKVSHIILSEREDAPCHLIKKIESAPGL